ncbi:uncharacterized protein LODBEIA_P06620 [Lodderomyces beijingensis]|uniref:Uncharacterized protein n=1 Tax=Lodderomyces beijingensis TaxID=1775926 RepID=A0ABP0ZFU4_9ASCO
MSEYGGLGIVLEEQEDLKKHSTADCIVKGSVQSSFTHGNLRPPPSATQAPHAITHSHPAQSSSPQPRLSISSRHSSNASLSNVSYKSSTVPAAAAAGNEAETESDHALKEVLLPPLPGAVEDLRSPSDHMYSLSMSESVSTNSENNNNGGNARHNHHQHNNHHHNHHHHHHHDDDSSNHSSYSQEFTPIYKNSDHSISNYALDSPTFFIDQQQQQQQQQSQQSQVKLAALNYFPTLTNTSTGKNTDSTTSLILGSGVTASLSQQSPSITPSSTQNQPSSEKSSPLKKLKNLKNGIKKLSLGSSSGNSNTSHPSSSNPTPTNAKFPNLNLSSVASNPRPILSPIQTGDRNMKPLASKNSAINSTSPTTGQNSANFSNQSKKNQHQHQHQPHHQPQHSSSSSTSTNSSLTSVLRAKRVRASSQGNAYNSFTPITPPPLVSLPLASPIITIGESLQSTRSALVNNIEQSYFDCLNLSNNPTTATSPTTTTTTTTTSFSSKQAAANTGNSISNIKNQQQPLINSIEEFTNLDDLLNFSDFLHLQKQQMTQVYDKTRESLESSGWCSQYELDNLKLQQDSSDAQIDTMILKIEEKLNRDFEYSVLNNDHMFKNPHCQEDSRQLDDTVISPSLKVLESRCFSFTDF